MSVINYATCTLYTRPTVTGIYVTQKKIITKTYVIKFYDESFSYCEVSEVKLCYTNI